MQKTLETFDREINQRFSKYATIEKWFSLLGFAAISYKIINLAQFAYIQFIRPRKNLLHRYGENSWAAVTGATDGIGKEFCIKLARIGFNIILISRDPKKLVIVGEEIQKENPKIKVKTLQADFSKAPEEGFFDKIYNEIKDLDISLLINNVGQSGNTNFIDFPEEQMVKFYGINCISQTMMTKILLEKLLNRERKSAIINLSSNSGYRPLGFLQPYGATKAFNDYFSRALEQEYGNKIDILSCLPGFVKTPMIAGLKLPQMIEVSQFVDAALDKLGWETRTPGFWKHAIFLDMYLARSEEEQKKANRKNMPKLLEEYNKVRQNSGTSKQSSF